MQRISSILLSLLCVFAYAATTKYERYQAMYVEYMDKKVGPTWRQFFPVTYKKFQEARKPPSWIPVPDANDPANYGSAQTLSESYDRFRVTLWMWIESEEARQLKATGDPALREQAVRRDREHHEMELRNAMNMFRDEDYYAPGVDVFSSNRFELINQVESGELSALYVRASMEAGDPQYAYELSYDRDLQLYHLQRVNVSSIGLPADIRARWSRAMPERLPHTILFGSDHRKLAEVAAWDESHRHRLGYFETEDEESGEHDADFPPSKTPEELLAEGELAYDRYLAPIVSEKTAAELSPEGRERLGQALERKFITLMTAYRDYECIDHRTRWPIPIATAFARLRAGEIAYIALPWMGNLRDIVFDRVHNSYELVDMTTHDPEPKNSGTSIVTRRQNKDVEATLSRFAVAYADARESRALANEVFDTFWFSPHVFPEPKFLSDELRAHDPSLATAESQNEALRVRLMQYASTQKGIRFFYGDNEADNIGEMLERLRIGELREIRFPHFLKIGSTFGLDLVVFSRVLRYDPNTKLFGWSLSIDAASMRYDESIGRATEGRLDLFNRLEPLAEVARETNLRHDSLQRHPLLAKVARPVRTLARESMAICRRFLYK